MYSVNNPFEYDQKFSANLTTTLELRTQNYLFDLIHLHFCYNNTIQYNTVQFMCLFIFHLVKENSIKVKKTAAMGAIIGDGALVRRNKVVILRTAALCTRYVHVQAKSWK